jgi:YebC/PmpR family DNA-binding regulatory protein
MAGHSQFKNIMHRKAAQDKKRAKVYTKVIRDIVSAVRSGAKPNGNPADNPVLKAAVDRAKAANMTKDVIERAIKRGTGEIKGADYEERTYEGYGPGGVAVLVKTLTDNPTRTITNVRLAFSKHGGNVGTDGSVAWMFRACGVIEYGKAVGDEARVTEAAIEAGADDVVVLEDSYRILTSVEAFASAREVLVKTLGEPQESALSYVPTQMQAVGDDEVLASLEKMFAMLNDDDDVQDVITNLAVAE